MVILGQDPYHRPGQANGLCFSVPRDVLGLPPSLRNIHAAMARDGFPPPAHGDLTGWARQGVLLLNTALSLRDSEANSHAKQWRDFTDAVITKLSDRQRPAVFVLWGKSAQRKRAALIDADRHEVVTPIPRHEDASRRSSVRQGRSPRSTVDLRPSGWRPSIGPSLESPTFGLPSRGQDC